MTIFAVSQLSDSFQLSILRVSHLSLIMLNPRCHMRSSWFVILHKQAWFLKIHSVMTLSLLYALSVSPTKTVTMFMVPSLNDNTLWLNFCKFDSFLYTKIHLLNGFLFVCVCAAVAAFLLDVAKELNTLTCLVYLQSVNSWDRNLLRYCSFLHIPSKGPLMGVEVNSTGDCACGMCLSTCMLAGNNILTYAPMLLNQLLKYSHICWGGVNTHSHQCQLS